jgi:hypothetical protein
VIRKSIIIAILLFISYCFFIVKSPRWWHASQHQWQENIIKAQDFIYESHDSIKSVIIGTSLSSHIIMDSLPLIYNLSFSGQSIFDGLKILIEKEKLPKTIFVEMNILLKEEDENFISTLTSSILFYPKKYLPALKEDKQPIGVFGKLLLVSINKHFTHNKTPKSGSINSEKKSLLFNKMLLIKKKDYVKLPEQNLINKQFNQLFKLINIIENKGSKIVFFEMPINSELTNLVQPKVIRNSFYNIFPKSIYKYIPIQDSIQYQTNDGLHLTKDEAVKYTTYLKSKMKA